VVCSVIDTQYDIIMWEELHKSDPLASAALEPLFCSSHIMTWLVPSRHGYNYSRPVTSYESTESVDLVRFFVFSLEKTDPE
jgi:hypothetical protein